MKPILEIQNISKKFRIQHEIHSYKNLRDSIAEIFKSKNNASEEFYALQDVSFNVMAGESIGIIGKNGAGKSTLLKILSKITPPSSGKIISRGRIASLLEVGTGFHGELSGYENIFLNGSILGMKKAEIQKNFDAIIDFSGVEKFLDTPLKHYSSGMQLRLAFAVAAFLENEILVIDEVLAVGDLEFQRKCMGKMEEISRNQGRTVLFVSHNLAAVQNLCKKGVVLKNGKITFIGTTSDAINNYTRSNQLNSQLNLNERNDRRGNGKLKILNIYITNDSAEPIETVFSGQDVKIVFEFETYVNLFNEPLRDIIISFQINSNQDVPLFMHHNRIIKRRIDIVSKNGLLIAEIKKIPLPQSSYNITYNVSHHSEILDYMENALSFNVTEGDFFGFGEVPPVSHGLLLVETNWKQIGN